MAPVSTARLGLLGEATSALPVSGTFRGALLVSIDMWVAARGFLKEAAVTVILGA